jgi:type 1 fimbria pilin
MLRSLFSGRWMAQGMMLLCIANTAFASTVTVRGTVQMPASCVINDGNPITVSFDEVLTTRIDGQNYRRPVQYTLNCPALSSNALQMKITGTAAGFSSGALQTSVGGLGIRLEADGQLLPVNSGYNFTWPQAPRLYATPIKQPGIALRGQDFSASASMVIDYQ